MKGQLFSMDFLIAVALVLLALGITLQALETSQRKLALEADLANGTAEAVVGALAGNTATALTCANPGCCISYSNGTGNCAGLSCAKHVLAARRLTICTGGAACLVEVRACG